MATAALLFAALSITSSSFQQDVGIPSAFTCDGAGKNPPLHLSGVPAEAKSLALIVFDPDVPKYIKPDGRYLHWALWNLSPSTTTIEEGRGGGLSENGRSGYIPPCPPNGEHRYVFQLFALNASLGDAKIAGETDLRQAMEGRVLERAELVGRYTSRTSGQLNFVLPGILALALVALVYQFIMARRS
jgi:Raf kinase inhibitor-like YbhB/YbcL family protein